MLPDVIDQSCGRHVGSQMAGVPSFHFEKVGDHPRPDLVNLALGARAHQYTPNARAGKDVAIEARHMNCVAAVQ